MRGRKPIPTSLKRARGNPGKRPLNNDEPQPDKTVPPCPAFLDEDAKAEWARVVEMLARNGIITELDSTALAAYCQAYSRWAFAERKLREYGPVILSPEKKFPIQSPYLAIANKAVEQMSKLLVEFGMTPSARSRIHIELPRPQGPLSRFFPDNRTALQRFRDSHYEGAGDPGNDLDAFVASKPGASLRNNALDADA